MISELRSSPRSTNLCCWFSTGSVFPASHWWQIIKQANVWQKKKTETWLQQIHPLISEHQWGDAASSVFCFCYIMMRLCSVWSFCPCNRVFLARSSPSHPHQPRKHFNKRAKLRAAVWGWGEETIRLVATEHKQAQIFPDPNPPITWLV